MPSLPTLLLVVTIAGCTALLNGTTAQLVAISGAFWVALLEFDHRGGRRTHAFRFVTGISASALACHFGWILLHLDRATDVLGSLFVPAGFCVLFAPIGVALASPHRSDERASYLAPAFGALPLGLATARLGCLAAGCCHGVALRGGLVPTQAIEIVGCALLSIGTRLLPPTSIPAATLAGLGVIRLVVEPWRAPDPLGPPILSTTLLAALLLAAAGLPLISSIAKRASA
ncbi:MAG: hypothetical protein GY937_03005 [bacterium]|nr:hypothetical protein [bacterium]